MIYSCSTFQNSWVLEDSCFFLSALKMSSTTTICLDSGSLYAREYQTLLKSFWCFISLSLFNLFRRLLMPASLLSIISKLHTSALMFGLWLFLLLKSFKFSLFWWLFKYAMRKDHVLFLALLFSKGSSVTDHVSCISSLCNNGLRALCLRLPKGPWRSAYDDFGFFFRLATNNHLVQSAKRYTVYLYMLRGVASLRATQNLFCYSNQKRKWFEKPNRIFRSFFCILSLLVNTIIFFETFKSREPQCSSIKTIPVLFTCVVDLSRLPCQCDSSHERPSICTYHLKKIPTSSYVCLRVPNS